MARTIVQAARETLPERGASLRAACGLVLCGPRELPAVAADLAAAGFSGVELHPQHLDGFGDPCFRGRVLDALDAAGLATACVNVGVVGDRAGVALAAGRCALAAALGATLVFALPPSRRAGTLATAAAHLRELYDRAAEVGLDVALHHHAGTAVETGAEIEEVLRRVDRPGFGVCFDTAHFALFDDDVAGGVRALGDRIRYVHLKDLAAARPALAEPADTLESVLPLTPAYTDLGAGVLDLRGVLAALREIGYGGWTTIEMETLRAAPFVAQARANAAALAELAAA